MTDLPANVRPVKDRHGKTRYRFRKKGLRSRYLPGEPGLPEFAEAYARCFDPTWPPARVSAGPRATRIKRFRIGDFRGDNFVYFIGGIGGVKIGTTINLPARLKKLQTGSPSRLKVLACVRGGADVEAAYHERFAEYRINGEWFLRRGPVLAEINRLKKEGGLTNPPMSNPRRGSKSAEIADG